MLVVEDDPALQDLIQLVLAREGFQVFIASTVNQALHLIHNHPFQVVILDWMLPQDQSGISLIRRIKQNNPQTVVLMLTAKSLPQDVVMALDAGADDYLTKPFDVEVLKARIRAHLRRLQVEPKDSQKTQWQVGRILLDTAAHEVSVAGQRIHLTPSEFKILLELMKNQGRVLTRDQLIARVQGEGIVVTGRTIDTHVFALRKKLGPEAQWIETIRGVGYRLKAQLEENLNPQF